MKEDIVSNNPQVIKIVEGKANWELLTMLMKREIGFTQEEYLESLVFVLSYEDLSKQAMNHLEEIPNSVKKNYVLKREFNQRVAAYILEEAIKTCNMELLSALLQNKWLPEEFLLLMAEKGNRELLGLMILNPLPLVATPEIMEKMLANPQVSLDVVNRIAEIKELFFDNEKETRKMDEEEMQDLLENVEGANMTTLQRISLMSVSEKIGLAFKGGKTERMILMRDPNKMVQTAVIESPKVSDDEVVGMANDRAVPGDIIAKIADSREWTRNYNIVLALVQNPKVPIHRATALIKQLHERDLKMLVLDKNISPVVRQLATNYWKTRNRK